MTAEDIYPLIPPVHFARLRTPFAKRALPFIALIFVYQLFRSRPASPIITPTGPTGPALVSRSSSDLPLPVAAAKPLPQSPQQQANEVRLLSIIDSSQSNYDPSLWENFRPPPFSLSGVKQTLYPQDEDEANTVGQRRVIDGHVPVTAVLLGWKRGRGMRLVLQMTAKYPFIREIIVWNNNVDVNIQASDFTSVLPEENPPHLRIFNSPSNVHDLAKHSACSLATYGTCYFNDDDWLNLYMDSMYTEYIESGAESNPRIVSNTMPIIHLEHRRWRFWNPDIDLHTGFTWLGTGSFAPKSLSTRFLQQVSSLPIDNSGGLESLSPEKLSLGDMFFSLWTNTWPHQMPNELTAIDVEGSEVGWSRGKGVDQWAVVYENILDAMRRLHSILNSRDPYLSPYPFHRSPPHPPSDARAPCANDECLFITSFDPFPTPQDLIYPTPSPKSRSWSRPWREKSEQKRSVALSDGIGRFDPFAIAHMKELEAIYNGMDTEKDGTAIKWPDSEWWTKNGSWHIAVNGLEDECWDSGRAIRRGDYFGLHFTSPTEVSTVTLIGGGVLSEVKAPRSERLWDVQTMAVGSEEWVSRTLDGHSTVTIRPSGALEVSFALEAADELIKKIRLRALREPESSVASLQICGWDLDGWTA